MSFRRVKDLSTRNRARDEGECGTALVIQAQETECAVRVLHGKCKHRSLWSRVWLFELSASMSRRFGHYSACRRRNYLLEALGAWLLMSRSRVIRVALASRRPTLASRCCCSTSSIKLHLRHTAHATPSSFENRRGKHLIVSMTYPK